MIEVAGACQYELHRTMLLFNIATATPTLLSGTQLTSFVPLHVPNINQRKAGAAIIDHL